MDPKIWGPETWKLLGPRNRGKSMLLRDVIKNGAKDDRDWRFMNVRQLAWLTTYHALQSLLDSHLPLPPICQIIIQFLF